jgi:outer membrane protein TolC
VEGTRWRYAQGITDYLPVLTAVRELQAAQRELLSRRRELVSLRVQLFRALGGETP